MKCSYPDCTIPADRRERRKVLMGNGAEGARAWLITVGPHAAAYALEAETLGKYNRRAIHPSRRRQVKGGY